MKTEELEQEFKKRIEGATITDIDISRSQDVYKSQSPFFSDDDLKVKANAVDIFIHLDNGVVLKLWNSEWGGITILKTEQQKQLREVEREERQNSFAHRLYEFMSLISSDSRVLLNGKLTLNYEVGEEQDRKRIWKRYLKEKEVKR